MTHLTLLCSALLTRPRVWCRAVTSFVVGRPPYKSNFYCHPGRAGGTPMLLAYPMRGEVTNRVLLGRKSPGCPAGVFAAVGTIWGASKLGGRNITKYLQPRNSPLARSRFKRDRCGKPTHFPVGKADDTVEETGASTRCTAGVGDPASKERLLEITSGSCRGQQGLVTTCKDSPNEAKSRRRREPNGSGA